MHCARLAARFEAHNRDEGRIRVTGQSQDAFAFRTPSLRNVSLTAPYGHSGAFTTLEGVVQHHMSPEQSLNGYDTTEAILPNLDGAEDWNIQQNAQERAALIAPVDVPPISLNPDEVADIVAFLRALTDEDAAAGRLGVPESVPSGLRVDR